MRFVARALLIVVLAAASAWAIRHWCYQPYQCSAALTEITASTAASDALRGEYAKVQRAERNIALLEELEPQCRTDVRLYVLLGNNESLAGRSQNAIRAYESALTIDRRPEIYIALANELLLLGRIDEAVDAFYTAARFSPAAVEVIPSEELARRVRERLAQRR